MAIYRTDGEVRGCCNHAHKTPAGDTAEDGALMATDITQPRATVGQAALDAEIARLRGADVRAALREKILRSHGTRVALSESLLADAIAALLDRATNMSQED